MDGNYEPPNCSSEEADVAAAESAVAEAESAVAAAEEAVGKAAKDHRMQMEQRNEMARQCLDMARVSWRKPFRRSVRPGLPVRRLTLRQAEPGWKAPKLLSTPILIRTRLQRSFIHG